MKTQAIATAITVVMHYYFGVSLLITLPDCSNFLLCLSSALTLFSTGMFLSRIKLCPNDSIHYYLLSIVEIVMFLSILESAVGLIVSVRHKLGLAVELAFPQLTSNEGKMMVLTDIIIFMMACAMVCTVLLDSQFLDKVTGLYRKMKQSKECISNCVGQVKSSPQKTQANRQMPKCETQYFNPQCPCHGDASMQAKSRGHSSKC